MNNNIRFITDGRGVKTHAVIPMDEFLRLKPAGKIKEPTDEELFDSAMAERNTKNTVPHEIVVRLVNGENPIKVYREWRGITQETLAEKTGSKRLYISQLENKPVGAGSTKMLRKIADVLDVDLDDLFP